MPTLLFILLLVLAGCTRWPSNGTGGLAEAKPLPPPALDEVLVLRTRLDCDVAKLDSLGEMAQAQGRLAGRVELTRRTAARAQREYLGGLPDDAAATLDQLERETSGIRLALGTLPANPLSRPECR